MMSRTDSANENNFNRTVSVLGKRRTLRYKRVISRTHSTQVDLDKSISSVLFQEARKISTRSLPRPMLFRLSLI